MATMTARQLPGRRSTCRTCQKEIVFAQTIAGENGPGGKFMPLDPVESPDGNTAVRAGHRGMVFARVLKKDETHEPPVEYLAMPHFATCTGEEPLFEVPAGVVDLAAVRRARNHSGRGR